jgi:3-methyl-2-oxobutanoate hydroxymethyltransferase
VISCEPDHNLEAIRRAPPLAMISAGMPHGAVASPVPSMPISCSSSAGMPHGAVASPEEAVRYGFAVLERGADAIYTSHSPFFVEAMAREGIPVTAHVGLVPNLAQWTSFRAIGRTPEEALKVFRAAKAIERAGAAFVEVEVVPVQLARHITQSTPMITMGMGCGTACDTQCLFSCDVLGTNTGHYPRHSKKYADFAALEAELQDKRIAALKAFVNDVNAKGYPAPGHQIMMDEDAGARSHHIITPFHVKHLITTQVVLVVCGATYGGLISNYPTLYASKHRLYYIIHMMMHINDDCIIYVAR